MIVFSMCTLCTCMHVIVPASSNMHRGWGANLSPSNYYESIHVNLYQFYVVLDDYSLLPKPILASVT